MSLVHFTHRVPGANDVVDESYVRDIVNELKHLEFPASEGYYLVLLSPNEALELRAGIKARLVAPAQAHHHGPEMLFETLRHIGAEYVCTLGDAVVATPRC